MRSLFSPLLQVRLVLLVVLTLLLSGWTTCSVMGALNSCPGAIPQPKVTFLSPDTVPIETESMVLQVNGSDFIPQSQIMWNGNGLPTTFVDSSLLQTTITQQTLASLDAAAGSTAQIAVMSPGSVVVVGCPNGGISATLVLVIN